MANYDSYFMPGIITAIMDNMIIILPLDILDKLEDSHKLMVIAIIKLRIMDKLGHGVKLRATLCPLI